MNWAFWTVGLQSTVTLRWPSVRTSCQHETAYSFREVGNFDCESNLGSTEIPTMTTCESDSAVSDWLDPHPTPNNPHFRTLAERTGGTNPQRFRGAGLGTGASGQITCRRVDKMSEDDNGSYGGKSAQHWGRLRIYQVAPDSSR